MRGSVTGSLEVSKERRGTDRNIRPGRLGLVRADVLRQVRLRQAEVPLQLRIELLIGLKLYSDLIVVIL